MPRPAGPPHATPHTGQPATPHRGQHASRTPHGGHSPDTADTRPDSAFARGTRASQAEPDHVVEQLGSAFAEGRLDQYEFDWRVQAALTAHTRAELDPLLADLPAGGAPHAGGAPRAPGLGPLSAASVAPSADERTLASLSHFTALFTSFIGPLVFLLTAGRDSAFVRDQAAESLNFQLTVLFANVALAFVTVLTFGLGALLYIPLGIGWFLLVVAGCVVPVLGRPFRYPLNVRMVR